MSELTILDPNGDTRLEWDSHVPEEVAAARETFERLREKRYLAYRLNRGGERGDVIRSFDPDAERIVMTPQMAGG